VYYEYFGLKQPPFRITPDTSLFFPGGNRGAILNAMIYAITSGEGIVKVVGEVGSGKTMLCRMLAVELPENVEVVYLANPSLSPDDILHAIAFELKLDIASGEDRLRVMNKLQQYLLQRHAENRQVVVFIEEAQGMPLATLEEIRLLSNLETQQHKLLQIVLFGQPELDQMITRREIRQLKERITYSFYLSPFKNEDIKDYLSTRLRACGYRAGDVFNNAAVREISRYSKGLLRRINILADKALLAAYAGNTHKVTAQHVRTAAQDSEFVAGWQRYRHVAVLMGAVLLLLLAIWLLSADRIIEKITATGESTGSSPAEVNIAAQDAPATEPEKPAATAVPEQPAQDEATLYQPEDNTHYYDYFSPRTASDTGPATLTLSTALAGKNLADNLLDDYLAQAIETGGSSLTGDETQWLQQQLRLLPPESGESGDQAIKCRLCTSIIYRPVIKLENL
jgi:type II secretory pathway predicted ATPase ExeA